MDQDKIKTDIEHIDLTKVPFAGEVLKEFNSLEYEISDSFFGSVNLSKVIGCEHPDYVGKSWGELRPVPKDKLDDSTSYQILKRGNSNLINLSITPEYYLNDSRKNHWEFYEVDGYYFISAGVHRSVIARFFFFYNDIEPFVMGVKITKARKKTEQTELNQKRNMTIWKKVQALFSERY